MYGDDTLVYNAINSIKDCTQLQNDLATSTGKVDKHMANAT